MRILALIVFICSSSAWAKAANPDQSEPSKWKAWAEERREDLKKPYSGYTPVDMLRLYPGTSTTVRKGEKLEFGGADPSLASLVTLTWSGGKSIQLQNPKDKKSLALDKLKGGALGIEHLKIQGRVAITGFIRDEDPERKIKRHLLLFLYDPDRKELSALTQFRTFAYDDRYRVEATVERSADTPSVTIPATRGEPKIFRRMGIIKFKLNDREETLSLLAERPQNKFVMLMFHDLSNGKETYAGGRYVGLDLPKPIEELKTGETLMVDFNYSVSPLCARTKAYMCPVPQESLQSAVRAGELKL